MRVSQIANTNFKAKALRIYAEKNKDYKFLNNKIMELTSVYSPFRSGKVLYEEKVGKFIEIYEPAKGLPEHLKELGIIFNIIA